MWEGLQIVNTDAINTQLQLLNVEVPSWAYGNSGTRFKVFAQAGVPRDPFEKVADAAMVHRMTGSAGSVAMGQGGGLRKVVPIRSR